MIARLLRATILIVLVFTKGVFAATTYYISKSAGADTNSGTSKTTPWAHLPGMAGCTGNCASHIPKAGDQFILLGGDTWGASDLGIEWQWTGTSGNPIYVGVDQTWFNSSVCGASWCRPIFNGTNSATAQADDNFVNIYTNANYTIFDNIEFTGGDGGCSYFYVTAPNIEIKNMYFHGWATGSNNNGGAVTGNGTIDGSSFHDSIIDGSDTNKNYFNGVFGEMPLVYNLYIRDVVSGLLGSFNIVHDILVEYPVVSCCGDHPNGIFNFGPYSGKTIIMYNNVVRHTTACPGCVNFWFDGDNNADSSLVSYGFNNVLYDLNPSNIFITGGHPPGPWGTYYIWNNTIECGTDSNLLSGGCFGNGEAGNSMTVYSYNNHSIEASGGTTGCGIVGSSCNVTTDLVQTLKTANGQSYTSSETYAFSPVSGCISSPCGTVLHGTNEQNLCSTIAAINSAAGTACQSDTTYAVGYNTTNHTVIVPGRTASARLTSSAWDIGAYQFWSPQTPQPPTNLNATIQ